MLTTDNSLRVKHLQLLTEGRSLNDIIIVETYMGNYSQNLTNGLFIPTFHPLQSAQEDFWLAALSRYLATFEGVENVREKIRRDFELDQMFSEGR